MAISYNVNDKKWNVSYEKTDYKTDYPTNLTKVVGYKKEVDRYIEFNTSTKGQPVYYKYPIYKDVPVYGPDELNNTNNAKINEENTKANEENTKKNEIYDLTVATASRTQGGDYVSQRNPLFSKIEQYGLSATFADVINNNFRNFYSNEKLQTWDSNLGAQPPYGTFDAVFYKQQSPQLASQWEDAVKKDDLDVVGRYNENSYYLWHYTTQGKKTGLRGNKAEDLAVAKSYVERKPTDKDIQDARNIQLGVNTDTQTERLLKVPEIAKEWEKAKAKDSYWNDLGKKYFLNPEKEDEFAALFRLSERPEDKEIAFKYNANLGYGITELEDALNAAVGEKAIVDVKRFGALTQDVLKETIAEMKQAKAKEQFLATVKGLPGFSEIMGFNQEITNSILGDSGIGGMLSITSGKKATESFEKSLTGITGINNNTSYNWQNWFDTELKKRYETDLELGFTKEGATENVKIQADFAKDFIEKYLVPRFNTSKSMNEFVDYLDVNKQEQNPFQTQDILNAVSLTADLRANKYLDDIRKIDDRTFNSDFYFKPFGNKLAEERYADQEKTVAQDWENAKKGDSYWAQQAYRFGVDLNNKDAFAKMHYQVKGRTAGYDPAQDILTAGSVQDEIYNRILPALKAEALKQGTVFGQFITPEEFAEGVLKNVNPGDTKTWEAVLKPYGLTSFQGSFDELKSFIANTLRTSSADEIRQQIKMLNDLNEKPRQELLGSSYIERPSDYTSTEAKPKTELYNVFQKAGYKGTEDEFYKDFFPDLDPEDQKMFSQTKESDVFGLTKESFSDPFKSLTSVENLWGSQEDEKTDTENMFNLNLDDEETNYKSKSGSQILNEFTSGFSLF